MSTVRFTNCSQCGHDWECKVDLRYSTKERIIEEREELDKVFGDHLCNRCTERSIIVGLKTNIGEEVDYKELDNRLKKKYGW